MGKSSTVNTLLGARRAKESEIEVGTVTVRGYLSDWRGVPVRIVDTPGFGDAVCETGNDIRYLEMIKAQDRPDLIAYVNAMTDQNFDNEIDHATLQSLIDHFGTKFLMASMTFVLTYADKRRAQFSRWPPELYRRFATLAQVNALDVARIPVVKHTNAADPQGRLLAGDRLWLQLLGRCSRVKSRFLLLQGERSRSGFYVDETSELGE